MGDVFRTETSSQERARVRREADIEVRSWFRLAKLHHRASINLYFEPNNLAFSRLCKSVQVRGLNADLYEFEGGLYQITSGCGDCEELLSYLGECQ